MRLLVSLLLLGVMQVHIASRFALLGVMQDACAGMLADTDFSRL